jgi:hypothetical protein
MAKKASKKSVKDPAIPPAGPSASDPARVAEHRKLVATSLTDGLLLNALTAVSWSGHRNVPAKLDDIRAAGKTLEAAGARVQAGDLGAAESLLMAQAVALNAMFAKFAEMAHQTDLVDALERFTRLALRAQSQCARTLEVLGGLKHPTVITRQANVAMNQQVVNGPVQLARVDVPNPTQNKLMGEVNVEVARMGLGTAREGACGNSQLETVAVEHGAPHRRGQSSRRTERE